MLSRCIRAFSVLLLAVTLSFTVNAQANTLKEKPSALAMTGDALFARPALLAMTAVGGVVYLASLPFSLLGGNAGEAGDVLVMEPAKATFVRCLGCTMSGRQNEVVIEQAAN